MRCGGLGVVPLTCRFAGFVCVCCLRKKNLVVLTGAWPPKRQKETGQHREFVSYAIFIFEHSDAPNTGESIVFTAILF